MWQWTPRQSYKLAEFPHPKKTQQIPNSLRLTQEWELSARSPRCHSKKGLDSMQCDREHRNDHMKSQNCLASRTNQWSHTGDHGMQTNGKNYAKILINDRMKFSRWPTVIFQTSRCNVHFSRFPLSAFPRIPNGSFPADLVGFPCWVADEDVINLAGEGSKYGLVDTDVKFHPCMLIFRWVWTGYLSHSKYGSIYNFFLELRWKHLYAWKLAIVHIRRQGFH